MGAFLGLLVGSTRAPAPPLLWAQQAEASVAAARLPFGWSRIPLPWPTELQIADRYSSDLGLMPGGSAATWLSTRDAMARAALEARRDTLWRASLGLGKLPPDFDLRRFLRTPLTVAGADTALARTGRQRRIDILPEALERYADLEIQVDGNGQLTSRWQTFEPCTLNIGQSCNSGAVPSITPQFQLRALAKGTISERVHVNVDFDQSREFDATNDLNVFYRGKPDEIVEFVELGQVTLPLPRSRFISQGVPAGNFGVRGDARLGPFRLRAVLAQQDGNVLERDVTLDLGGGQKGVLQDVENAVDDVAYQSGQFFFIVDPREIPGYPNIDVLALQGTEVPDSLRPSSSIKLYRHEVVRSNQPPNVEAGVIQARAVAMRPPGADPALPDSAQYQGFFRPMFEGEDYIVHRSGLWAVVRSPLQREEALAATYIAQSGDSVGDFDAEEKFRQISNAGQGELPRLLLLKDAETHRPGGVTWEKEMHHIYRITSSEDVEPGSIELVISQGPLESGPVVRVAGGEEFTFLEIFGLDDQPRDDRVDAGRVWRPSNAGEFAGTTVLTGNYLVFPALEPFQNPPPIRSQRVPSIAGQPFPLAEGDRNRGIYEEPIDQTRLTSFRYRLNFRFRARSSGMENSFSLGAIGIRRGSERVTLAGKELTAGEDYTIDYDVGQLTLLRPNELVAADQNPDLKVRFEQKPLFDVGAKSILGLTGEYTLGTLGNLSFIGLFQNEGTVRNRPELGLEPSGIAVGGVVANLDFESGLLDRLVNGLPGVSTSTKSRVTFNGELAGSDPTTNRAGVTWVDDFEGTSGLPIGLTSRSWRFGSRVSRPELDGAGDFLPDLPDISNQLEATWQSQWDDGGTLQGALLISQIDPELAVLNAGARGNVLWLSLSDPPASGENGWFSITHVLSQTGIDLTTSEFLEFYASTLGSTDEALSMIIDIGTVSEDAYVADSLGLPSGLGELDQEADPAVGVWGNPDDVGLWDTGCVSVPNETAFPLGDPRENCTNQNGVEDTEDLNRDNFLNTDERFFRYVVPLTVPSRYLNRPTGGEFRFNLYRVPLRIPDFQVSATEQDQQNVRHIRITLTSASTGRVLISRMRFSGTAWLKRAGSGSVAGLIGEQPGTAGTVGIGPISTVDQGYVSPPGLTNQQADKTAELSLSTAAINEQSLRLTFTDIPPGERVEVFRRFTDRPRDFLPYGRLRAWTMPVTGEWGPDGPLRFFIRFGFDSNNFYLYRVPLPPARGESPGRDDWRPEDVIDFQRLLDLRVEAERRLNEAGSALPGDSTLIVWDVDVLPDGDSTLALVINDRSRAPNLAGIRELALGVENLGELSANAGELWIGDMRLDRAPDQFGVAGVADLSVALADVLQFQGRYSSRNPFYRQLGSTPNYQAGWDLGTRGTLEFGRLLPDAWGLSMPVGFQHDRSSDRPFFLPQTDVRAGRIDSLRTAGTSATRWNVSLSKQKPSGGALLRSTIDGVRLSYGHRSSRTTATQTESDGSGWVASLNWARPVVGHSLPIVPGFVRALVDLLPDVISESRLLTNFKNLRLRWTPRRLGFGASLDRSTSRRRRFESSLLRPGDGAVTPSVNRQYNLAPNASFELQPFPSVVYSLSFASLRDLVEPRFRADGESSRRLLREESGTLLGMRVGWETNRTVSSRLSWQPDLSSWFDARFDVTTAYRSQRNASYVQPLGGDTILVRDLSMNRDIGIRVDLRPADLLSAFGVPDRLEAKGFAGALREAWDRLRPVRIDWNRSVNATFDRRDIRPGLSQYLVLSGLRRLRFLDADTASAAADNRAFSVDGGLRLPLNLEARVGYTRRTMRTFTARNRRGSRTTEWPDVRVDWRNVPLPSGVRRTVRNLTLSAGWREQERITETQTGQDQGNDQTVLSAGALLVFGNGFNLSYRYDATLTDRTDATGLSESSRGAHSVRATGSLHPPSALSFLRQPLRLSLDYSRNGNFDCRELGGSGFGGIVEVAGEGCTPHVDQLTQNASFTLDTDFTGYSLGIQFSWVRRSSAVGRRQTTNQYNFNIFGRFFFRSDEGQVQ